MKIGFLGTGKMATAIARGLLETRTWPAKDILGMDIAETSRCAFNQETGVSCTDSIDALAAQADILILAVKPQNVQEAAARLGEQPGQHLIISIAAGLGLSKLQAWFGHDRLIRVMPNTPAMVGRGAAVYACAPGVEEQDRQIVERIFGAVGLVRPLEETLMDAATALSGSGPAYVFEMIQGLVEAAAELGLEPELALELTAQTVLGSAMMVARKIAPPETLRDAVTSPGGTTEAGLKSLREAGFREILKKMLTAARDRSRELGK